MLIKPDIPGPDSATSAKQVEALRDISEKLEASFLSEMLKYTGLGDTKGEFSGGIGEQQFSGFLREQQANQLARVGGIGIAEHIFQSLLEDYNAAKIQENSK